MSSTITTTTITTTTTTKTITTPCVAPATAIADAFADRPYTMGRRRTRAFALQLWEENPPPDDWHTIPRELQIARIRLASRVLAVTLGKRRTHAFELDIHHIHAASVIRAEDTSRMLVVEYADNDALPGSADAMPHHALVHWDDALRVMAWLSRARRSGDPGQPPTSRDALRRWIAFDMPGWRDSQPEPTPFTTPDAPAAFYQRHMPLGPRYYTGTVWPPTPERNAICAG